MGRRLGTTPSKSDTAFPDARSIPRGVLMGLSTYARNGIVNGS